MKRVASAALFVCGVRYMAWWMWVIIVPVALYATGGVWYIVRIIKDPCVYVTTWYGWIVNFLLWPLAWMVDEAIGGMLM